MSNKKIACCEKSKTESIYSNRICLISLHFSEETKREGLLDL